MIKKNDVARNQFAFSRTFLPFVGRRTDNFRDGFPKQEKAEKACSERKSRNGPKTEEIGSYFFRSNSFIFEPKVEKIYMGVFSTQFVPLNSNLAPKIL